ncbi:MAG: transcriptional regulator [Desulfobacteraceae bacterium]
MHAQPPREARQTLRRRMIELLMEREMTDRDLSQALGIREKEVYFHLSHVARSLGPGKRRLRVTPVRCLKCGYVFRNRKRLTRPSRCPECKGTHLERPSFRIEAE